MNYNTLEKYFSHPRLQKYLNHFPGNKKRALKLYRANLRLSQSFYPLLSVLEVSLRNSIDSNIKALFADPDWIRNQSSANGFMSDSSLCPQYYLKNNVNRALIKLGPKYSNGKLISELTFGFWTEFFDKKNYKLLSGRPIHIFPHLPTSIKRNNIYSKLNTIRVFRNRISHNEPICFRNGNIDLAHTKHVYQDIMEIFSWFDDDLLKWCTFFDFVNYEISHTSNAASTRYFIPQLQSIILKIQYAFKKIYNSFRVEKVY